MDIQLNNSNIPVIAKLLAKLGLELEVQKDAFYKFIITRGNSFVIFKNTTDFEEFFMFKHAMTRTLHGMWHMLCNYQEIHYLEYVDGIPVEHAMANPFLGCHSLDEACIKIDLLAESTKVFSRHDC